MPWLFIFIASIFEVSWAIGLKYSNGFTKLFPSIFTIISMILSYVFLSFGVKHISLGTAYAVWTGIGVLGTTIYGIFFFNESKEFLRIFFIILIFIGIIGIRLISKE